MATVNKNFVVKNGLVVQGTTATVNGNSILTEGSGDSYILSLVGGTTLVKSVSSDFSVDTNGELQISLASDLVRSSQLPSSTDDILEGNTNKYFTAQRAVDAISAALGNGIEYTGTLDVQVGTGISINGSNQLEIDRTTVDGWYDAAGTASDAINSALSGGGSISDAIASAISGLSGQTSQDITDAITTAEQYTDTAVANVVGLAPAALDTLQELAAAFDNSPDTLTNLVTTVGGKQDSLFTGSGIDITSNTISVKAGDGLSVSLAGPNLNKVAIDRSTVDGWYDASGAASTAESNANSYTDTAVGNIASAVSQIQGASIAPDNVTINSVANQYASQVTGLYIADGPTTVMGISATNYRTVKALVKAKSGTHTQVSELLITLDSSNNVAVTEYAIVSTNGSLGNADAMYAAGNIYITFTAAVDNIDAMCYATALI